MQLRKLLMMGTLALTLLLPSRAYAQDWFFTPFIGANFGQDANFGDFDDFDDEFEKRLDFGASVGWNPNVVGFEIDFGFSPNFFENTVGDSNFDFGDSNVTTLMANVHLTSPNRGQGIRPFGSAGLGLIRSRVSDAAGLFDELTTNDFGMNVGGGIEGSFSSNFGIRGDIRYFRSLQDNEPDDEFDLALSDFDFWRGTVGVTFRW